ncbi:MAG: DUF2283 domain-containing protein [Dehalococcoidia bacterium]
MRITYDPEVDALYIRFRETSVTTERLAGGLALDYDTTGRLAGIEVLDARSRLGDLDSLDSVTLDKIAKAS